MTESTGLCARVRGIRPRDRGEDARCAAAFGLTGGELCGCHQRGCDTCASNRGCGTEGCGTCVSYGWQTPRKVAGAPRVEFLGKSSHSWSGSKDTTVTGPLGNAYPQGWRAAMTPRVGPLGHPYPRPVVETGVAPHGGVGATVYPADAPFDIHAHNFATLDPVEQEARIERLVGMGNPMVLMGSKDGKVEDAYKTRKSDEINNITADAAERHPGTFYPFCHVLPEEFTLSGTAGAVEGRLEDGFVGIGELYVHGHLENIDESDADYDNFVELFRVAARHDVPVSVHWDLGSTDPAREGDAEVDPEPKHDPAVNAAQFLGLLATLEEEGLAPTIILCHCGAGPDVAPELIDDYKANFELILAYENVYFDLAGMQVGQSMGTPDAKPPVQNLILGDDLTPLGQFLLDQIKRHVNRFLIGTDVDDGSDEDIVDDDISDGDQGRYGVNTYKASWANYDDFLSRRTSDDQELSEVEVTYLKAYNALGLVG